MAASMSTLHRREHRQSATLWRDSHTLLFFRRHRWLLRRLPTRRPARQAVRFARAELRWTRRELGETREALHPKAAPDDWAEFACIHEHEGATTANTGNGYYGGLQMDYGFQRTYGREFLARWGTADRWPVWAQVVAARRARDSGRGYGPWPNTARLCGLI
jgi:hypothetical protein